MPIFVDTNNGPSNKLYNGTLAGSAASAAESMMQKVVKRIIDKTPGFTTAASPNAKGYAIRLEISKLDATGGETKCSMTGSIVQYPKGANKAGAKGDTMFSLGWGGSAKSTGTSQGSVLDCVEAITESMMSKGIPVMSADFQKR
jgi:hypothetical protein